MQTVLDSRVVLWLLAAMGLITLPHVGHLPVPLSAFFYALLCWRWLAIGRPRFQPNGMVISLLTLFAIALLYAQHQGIWGRDAGTSVFVVASGLKLMELHRQRDVYLVCYLAFILAASQFLYQQSIVIAAYSLLVCCILLAALVTVSNAQVKSTTALRTAATIIMQALPLAAILFVLFPRVQAPAWMVMTNKNQAQSGLGDTLEPGSINELALSPQLAFRAKFNGQLPPRNQRYWRGPVFSYTDGKVWRLSRNDYVVDFQDTVKFSGKAYHYTLLQEPQSRNWVYALDMPAHFDASLQRNGNYQLISQTKPGEAAEYALTSYLQYNTGYLTKTEYRDNRQLPGPPSVRILDLVKQLQGFEGKPERFIEQLLAYFRQQQFIYTLQPPLMEQNPIETFLFEARSGFCNHYATAFVYLMRVADIPARVVTGYQGGELNTVGRFLEIRQANAHAWAEVWLEGRGWVRVDPTTAIMPERIELDINVQRQIETGALSLTPGDVDQQDNFFGFKQSAQLWKSLDYHWQRWIVSYGGENQLSLLSAVGIDSLIESMFWLPASTGLALIILSMYLFRYRHQPEDPAVLLYRQFCKKMANAGVVIRLGEGANDFAVRAKAQKPEIAGDIDEITRIFVQLRYQRSHSRDDLILLKKYIKGLD